MGLEYVLIDKKSNEPTRSYYSPYEYITLTRNRRRIFFIMDERIQCINLPQREGYLPRWKVSLRFALESEKALLLQWEQKYNEAFTFLCCVNRTRCISKDVATLIAREYIYKSIPPESLSVYELSETPVFYGSLLVLVSLFLFVQQSQSSMLFFIGLVIIVIIYYWPLQRKSRYTFEKREK